MISDELPQERFEYPHPLAPYNADQELALLRGESRVFTQANWASQSKKRWLRLIACC